MTTKQTRMTKKRAIEITKTLFSIYQSDYERTQAYEESKEEYERAIVYIKNNLK